MIQFNLVPHPEFILQVHGRVEQLIVVVIFDRRGVQDPIYVGRVTDETTGVQVPFTSRHRWIVSRQGFIRPAIRLRGEQDSSPGVQEPLDDGGQTAEKYNIVTESKEYTR